MQMVVKAYFMGGQPRPGKGGLLPRLRTKSLLLSLVVIPPLFPVDASLTHKTLNLFCLYAIYAAADRSLFRLHGVGDEKNLVSSDSQTETNEEKKEILLKT